MGKVLIGAIRIALIGPDGAFTGFPVETRLAASPAASKGDRASLVSTAAVLIHLP